MNMSEIPLTPDNQSFSITISEFTYKAAIAWRETCWFMDLMDNTGSLLIGSIPLVTGVNLLSQYQALGLGFSLIVLCDAEGQEYPTKTDLGIGSHLYVVTE
ncbi:phage baseplate plug protein [Erwiniaceae bacterium CAU 1747]